MREKGGLSPRAHGFDQRGDRRVRSRWSLELLVRIVNSFGSKSHGPSHTPPFQGVDNMIDWTASSLLESKGQVDEGTT